jgi:SAM-dependent methyltransferase
MEKASDSSHPDFWTTRYAAGKTPWDFGGVPAALKSFLARSSVPMRVLIPGCGSGYEVQAFHAGGYDVTSIDFSPAAVDQARRVLGGLAERSFWETSLHTTSASAASTLSTNGHFFVQWLRPAGLTT